MTKTEFEDYLDGFGKDTGEFTEDELYEIGCKYKELPVSEKDWKWLVEKLGPVNEKGEPKSGETFRIWIKSRQYSDGTIKKNIQLLSGKTVEDLSFPEAEAKLNEVKRDLYIQQTKTRDEHNSYRRTLRDEARIESIKDLMVESIKELKHLPEVSYDGEVIDGSEAVLLLSDLHIGVMIDNFYNKYDSIIARKRVNKLVNDVVTYCKRNSVSRLNVLNLGDMIQGIIHVTARLEEEQDVIQQVILASEILADALVKLQEAAPEIVYRSCTDNHARVIADKNQHIEKENFGKLIDFYLEARLKDTNVIFAKDNLDDDIGMFTLMNNKKMVFVHGHRDNYNTIIQGFLGATRQFIDYVCLGHFHCSKMKEFQGAKVIVNGSIVGSEQYAQSRRLYGTPEQTLMLFEGENVSTTYINLDIKE